MTVHDAFSAFPPKRRNTDNGELIIPAQRVAYLAQYTYADVRNTSFYSAGPLVLVSVAPRNALPVRAAACSRLEKYHHQRGKTQHSSLSSAVLTFWFAYSRHLCPTHRPPSPYIRPLLFAYFHARTTPMVKLSKKEAS